jgi:hypothetical protein
MPMLLWRRLTSLRYHIAKWIEDPEVCEAHTAQRIEDPELCDMLCAAE